MTRPDQTRPDYSYALVSVIVPAYNTEKYLSRCLDSILSQTYSNLEVILIDDGSIDLTGRICDDYAGKDERVKVIHQTKNQGQAVGRNIGLKAAKGEWIQFVDADDWIEPETIETCFKYAQKYNADVVCFRCVYEHEDGTRRYPDNQGTKLMDTSEALSMVLLSQYVEVIACNKFMKAKTFRDVEFPPVRQYEDIYTMYKVIANAEKIFSTNETFYHYFQHNASTSHRTFSERTYDIADAAEKYFEFAMKHSAKNINERRNIYVGFWFWKMMVANHMIRAGSINMEYVRKVQREIKMMTVLRCRNISLKRKIQFTLFRFFFGLYSKVYMKAKNS